MRLSLQELEPRETPAVDLGGGVLHLSTGHEYQVFPDYAGALVWLTNANGVTTVAPSPNETNRPGGPRVATLDGHGNRTQPDYFAGPPDSRCGVALVDTGGTVTLAPTVHDAPPPEFDVPAVTRGSAGDPNTWTVYLDFERPSSAAWVRGVVDEAWRILEPLGDAALTTTRPDDYPGNYGTVVVGADLGFTGDQGDTVARWDEPHSDWESGGVFVDGRPLDGRPQPAANVGQVVAHEVGHALGLGHDKTPGSVMQFGVIEPGQTYTPADVLAARAGAAKAVAVASERRMTSESAEVY